MVEARLTRAGMVEARLTRAGMVEARLTRAWMVEARLTRAWMAKRGVPRRGAGRHLLAARGSARVRTRGNALRRAHLHQSRSGTVERFAKPLHHKSTTFERNVCARHTFW
jgi:hypothetical protein